MKHNLYTPVIPQSSKIFDGAIVVGEVYLGEKVSVWYHAVIRGDMAKIVIGNNTNIQDNAVIHTNTDMPTLIGDNVTVGHGAIIHAATIEDNCLIGMGSIILDGAYIEQGAMVGAGCLVPPGKIVPKKHLAIGNPMKIVRELTEDEVASTLKNAEHYIQLMGEYDE